jgi:L-iditol 2-dehydrogenase
LWAYKLPAPRTVERVEAPEIESVLSAGQVLLRFRAAGLCGSDMPRYRGIFGPSRDGDYGTAPVHEVVGEVIRAPGAEFGQGQRVVGTLGRHAGLAETVVASASQLIAVPDELSDVEAVTIQSLATVLRAVEKFPDLTGVRGAVLGAGPIGLAFCHVLKRRGIAHTSAVDPVERSAVARAFGADEFFCMSSGDWLKALEAESRPQVVVEAVGHQTTTIRDAVTGVAEHGFIFGFGEPDEADYSIPYEQLYLKDATLASGRTIGEWPVVLAAAAEYLVCHRADFDKYISHVVPVRDAQLAYSLYEQPQAGRIKVVIVP